MTDTFGESPFTSTHSSTVTQPQINWLKIAVLTFVIILVLYTIYKCFQALATSDYRSLTRKHFNNLHGNAYDDEAKRVIEYGEAIPDPQAIDHYRIGTAYLLNADNPRDAHRHFTAALRQVIEGKVDARDAPFIIERIDDHKNIFVDFADVEDLPLQQALEAHFENIHRLVDQVPTKKKEIASDDPEFTQKTLMSRQTWQSDSQNVHDQAIYQELKKQYVQVRDENAKIKNITKKDYLDACTWLKTRFNNDQEKKLKIDKVLDTLDKKNSIGYLNITEQDLLTAVWQRAHDPENAERTLDIKNALAEALLDCIEGASVVCLTGRTAKIWQALARLDKNPDIGILKTKQLLRNEIYERCAKIVDKYIGASGTCSEELKQAYNKQEDTEQVAELIECIKKEIDGIHDDYQGLIDREQLTLILDECKANV